MVAHRPAVRWDPIADGILEHTRTVFGQFNKWIRKQDPELDLRIEARRLPKRQPRPSA